mmetsp:Transcript_27442/g.24322  ORF Transcript_27442/g.24322 Transcript_27442/m.24322 type:complete len:133 (+) Transcript_27442:260-658(+)
MTQYCIDNNLALNKCGKYIVASNEKEYEQLYEIYRQGITNGIDIQLMSRQEALKREPLLRGYGEDVIWSPSTSVANPKEVITKLSAELDTKYGKYCTQFYEINIQKFDKELKGDKVEIVTPKEVFEGRYLIN